MKPVEDAATEGRNAAGFVKVHPLCLIYENMNVSTP